MFKKNLTKRIVSRNKKENQASRLVNQLKNHQDSAPTDILTHETYSCENLRGAQLEGLNLSATVFCDANLSYANLARVSVHGGTTEPPQELKVHFAGANLSHAILQCADLRRCYFLDSNLIGADFRGADLSAAEFSNAKLQRADFRGANLTDADLSGCFLANTKLDGAIFHRTNLQNATLSKHQVQTLNLTQEQLRVIKTRDIPSRKKYTIYQYSLDNRQVGVYTSFADMERKTGFPKKHIRISCELEYGRCSFHNYYWSYVPIRQQ